MDCAAALKLNPRNVKAFYRSSLALLALDKIPEAEDAASRGLKLDQSNQPLKNVAVRISARRGGLAEIDAKKKAERDRSSREKLTLMAALKARDIKMRSTSKPPELEDAVVHLTLVPL